MHLGNDHTLGAVDDESAVWRHQWHVAHEDVLLFDVFYRLRTCIFVDFKHDQAKRHFKWRAVCHITMLAFFDVILGLFQLIVDEFQNGGFVEIFDRENRLEDTFDAFAVHWDRLVT